MEIVFHCGTCLAPNSNVSTINFIEGFGGKMYVFCAIYSFKMSFWMVPRNFFQSTPCFSATTRYIDQRIAAGALVVMEVLISASGIPLNKVSISANESIATPHLPISPFDM